MDLSFTRFDRASSVAVLPSDLAVLLVGIAARQAASPTALIHAHLTPVRVADGWSAPKHGSFNQRVAVTLTLRKRE